MATFRQNPYGAFNFIVSISDLVSGNLGEIVGGFSDVSGLGNEVQYSEYRNGNEQVNTVRKVANSFKVDDVTLKRGIVGSTDLFDWLKEVRDGEHNPRTVTITMLDEARKEVAEWVLHKAQPKKWTGPTLAAKGGGEVSMEELSFVTEMIEYK